MSRCYPLAPETSLIVRYRLTDTCFGLGVSFDQRELGLVVSVFGHALDCAIDELTVFYQNNEAVYDNGDKELLPTRTCCHIASQADLSTPLSRLELQPLDTIYIFAPHHPQPQPFASHQLILEEHNVIHYLCIDFKPPHPLDLSSSSRYTAVNRSRIDYFMPTTTDFHHSSHDSSSEADSTVVRLKVDRRTETMATLISRLHQLLVTGASESEYVVSFRGVVLFSLHEPLVVDDSILAGWLDISFCKYQLTVKYRDQTIRIQVASTPDAFNNTLIAQLKSLVRRRLNLYEPPAVFRIGVTLLVDGTLASNGVSPLSLIECLDVLDAQQGAFAAVVSHTVYRSAATKQLKTRHQLLTDCTCVFRLFSQPAYSPSPPTTPLSSPTATQFPKRKVSDSFKRLNENRKRSSPVSSPSNSEPPLARVDDSSWMCSCLQGWLRIPDQEYNTYSVCDTCHIVASADSNIGLASEDATGQVGDDHDVVVCPCCKDVIRSIKRFCYFTPASASAEDMHEEIAAANRTMQRLYQQDPSVIEFQRRQQQALREPNEPKGLDRLFDARLTAFRVGFVAHFTDKKSVVLSGSEASVVGRLAVDVVRRAIETQERRPPTDNMVWAFIIGAFLAAAQTLNKPLPIKELHRIEPLYIGGWDQRTMSSSDAVYRTSKEFTSDERITHSARKLSSLTELVAKATMPNAVASSSSSASSASTVVTIETIEQATARNLAAVMAGLLHRLKLSEHTERYKNCLLLPPSKGGYFEDVSSMMRSLGLVTDSVFTKSAETIAAGLVLLFSGYVITNTAIAKATKSYPKTVVESAHSLHQFLSPAMKDTVERMSKGGKRKVRPTPQKATTKQYC